VRYLLDTNVISEPFKRVPEKKVVDWFAAQSALDLCISVLTLGELTMGFELAPAGKRRDDLQNWVTQDLPRRFVGRLLPVDEVVAREWGQLSAEGRAQGRELPAIDGLLLATARVHDLTLVTRNQRDCAGRGVPVLNPWD
jgi:predicted nucleic acid-binding protein